jgi:hypothetical protein
MASKKRQQTTAKREREQAVKEKRDTKRLKKEAARNAEPFETEAAPPDDAPVADEPA